MSDPEISLQARREAVQPSLWDRLVDDLPGVIAETDSLQAELIEKLGDAETLDRILSEGTRGIDRYPDLDDDTRRLLHLLNRRRATRDRLESRGIVVTPDILREAVRRDIEMLFNVERLEAGQLMTERESITQRTQAEKLADFPEVRRSVVNYGVPSFAGRTGTDFDKDALAREVKDVLAVFEPRLKADTLKVQVRFGEKTGMRIDIDGVLMLSPVPERLRLSTSIDLDNGQAATVLEEV